MSIEAAIQYARTMVDISNIKAFEDFVTHVDLVMEGLRAAYFFDSSIINLQKAREIICCMSSYFKIIRKVVLITLSDDTGDGKPDQYAVISPMRLMDSYQMLQSPEWAFSFLPLSICSIAPFHCTDDMMREIQKELLITLEPLYNLCLKCNVTPHALHFDPIASDINIVKLQNNRDIVGNIFLEGFLEDYVCVYHRPSPPPTPDLTSFEPAQLSLSDVPHCLYLSPLKRYTLTCVCRRNRQDADVATVHTNDADESTYLVTVCEFTVPKTYLDCSEDSIFLFSEMLRHKVMYLKNYASDSHLVLNVLMSHDEYKLNSFKLTADAGRC